jgi:hypothetical protein
MPPREAGTERMHEWLDDARRSGTLVRLIRGRVPEEDAEVDGYVVALGPELVALHVLSDRIDLDGYEVLRQGDLLAAVDGFPSDTFYKRALVMKGETPVVPAWLDLSSLAAAIESIRRNQPLVVLHRERMAPGEVAVGCVRQALPSGIRLHWITPRAEWEDDPTLYRYDSITRVQFGGEYERTLALIAGPPPDADSGS